MSKIVTFIFLIVGQTQSYVFKEPPNAQFDTLGNCLKMFPKDHVIRRGCYCAHTVCHRYNLSPSFVNELIFNNKIYHDIEMKLPSGARIPYFIYEADPSLFHALYDEILIQTDPQLTLNEYRQIIKDSDFRIAKALHHTNDITLLTEMIEIMLDHLHEDDVTAIVGDWFQGDLKIIAPLIYDYLPELENITIVKIADNYPKLSLVRKVMNDRNVMLTKVNPRFLSPVTMNDGQEIRVEKIREILDFMKTPNATVLPGVEHDSLKNMTNINEYAALPFWQWVKVHDEIQLKNYPYGYYEKFPPIQLIPGIDTASEFLVHPTQNPGTITVADALVNDNVGIPDYSLEEITSPSPTYKNKLEDDAGSSTSTLENEPAVLLKNEIFQESSDSNNDENLHNSTPSFNSEAPANGEFYDENVNQDSQVDKNTDLNRENSTILDDVDDEDRSEEKTPEERISERRVAVGRSADEDTDLITRQSQPAAKSNPRSKSPYLEISQPNTNLSDHLPTTLSLFSKNENGSDVKFPNKIFTTCALYYLKVNSTQNRVILSEAGLLSFPIKRICEELLRLETYNGSHIQRFEQRAEPLKNRLSLDEGCNEKSAEKDSAPNIFNKNSYAPPKSSASLASHQVQHSTADLSIKAPFPTFSTRASREKTNGKYESLSNNRDNSDGPKETISTHFEEDLGADSLGFPVSSVDSANRFSHKRGLYQRNHEPVHLPNGQFAHHRFNPPTYLTRPEESFYDDAVPLSEYDVIGPLNHRRSQRLPRTASYKQNTFEAPYYDPNEMKFSPITSEIDKELDSVNYASQDELPYEQVNSHFRRANAYPFYNKNFQMNRRFLEDKLRALYKEEMENNEERHQYFVALKDMKNQKSRP